MHKRLKILLLILCTELLQISFPLSTLAQANADSLPLNQEILHSTGFSFDDWVERQFKRFRTQAYNPDTVSVYVVGRLNLGRMVSTKTIRTVQRMHQEFDLIALSQQNLETINLDIVTQNHSKVYIQSIIPFLSDRPLLVLELKGALIGIAQLAGDTTNYVRQLEELSDRAYAIGKPADQVYISALNTLGNHYFFANNCSVAEKYYLDVLSYNWPLIMEQSYQRGFRDMYINAGTNLLHCRRYNLDKLNNTYFLELTLGTLGPIKQRYIEEAQKQ